MMREPFVLTVMCRGETFCGKCRDTGDVGKSFRGGVELQWDAPAGWACPKGKPWRVLDVRPVYAIPDDYDPATSPTSPRRGSCCDAPRE